MTIYKQKVDNILQDSRLLPDQLKSMKLYKNDAVHNRNLSYRTVWNKLWNVQRLALVIKKPFELMDESDLQEYFYEEHEIDGKLINYVELETSSTNEYKRNLKVFFQFLKHNEPINWFQFPRVKKTKTSDEMLEMEEIEAMIDKCRNVRNKAIIAVFYDSGCRVGEMHNLNYGNVNQESKLGVFIKLRGKTGEREIPLNTSVKYLLEYLNAHPTKQTSSPLWMALEDESRLSIKQFDNIIKDLAYKTGLMEKDGNEHKKVVYPHLFRHTRLTHLASMPGINESVLRQFAGWSASSKMPEVYIHMSQKQVHMAILSAQGIDIPDEEVVEYKLQGWTCALGHENGISSVFCWGCGQQKDRPVVIDRTDEQRLERIVEKVLSGNVHAANYMVYRNKKIKEIEKQYVQEGLTVEEINALYESRDVSKPSKKDVEEAMEEYDEEAWN